MKALLQRVTRGSVTVDGEIVGSIDQGLVVLLGIEKNDDHITAAKVLEKLLNYRVFSDDQGKMNLSVRDINGGVLLVSQFTLAADTKKGLRPGFSSAAAPGDALALYNYCLDWLRDRHSQVSAGEFGANMQVSLVNDGPVTFLLEG